jgi:hypothetical protein
VFGDVRIFVISPCETQQALFLLFAILPLLVEVALVALVEVAL